MVLLIGTHQIISQIFQAFSYMNVSNLPELIRTGRLDLMLLLPLDTQFAVSTRQFGLDNLVNAGRRESALSFFRWPSSGSSPAPTGSPATGSRCCWGQQCIIR